MKRDKWILKVRNTLSGLAMECDSCAAIEGAKMTRGERAELQNTLRATVKWIDANLGY